MTGTKGVIEPTFVKSDLYASQGVDYFASNVELGVSVGVSDLDPRYETQSLARCTLPSLFLSLSHTHDQPNGVEKIFGVGTLSVYEDELLKTCLGELKKNIDKGVEFAVQKMKSNL